MWYVGQKVRCVNDRFPSAVLEWGSNLPKKGQIYTIRSIEPTLCGTSDIIGPGFLLEELHNPYDRLHFDPNRFIPVNPKEVSLEQALRRTTQLHEEERERVASKVQRMLRILTDR